MRCIRTSTNVTTNVIPTTGWIRLITVLLQLLCFDRWTALVWTCVILCSLGLHSMGIFPLFCERFLYEVTKDSLVC